MMGERSSVSSAELETVDDKKFLASFMAEKLSARKELLYHFESIKFVEKNECQYQTEGEIWVDWDDWKIQGYWYKEFCEFLNILQKCGLRGQVDLQYSDGTPYTIRFETDGVFADIRGEYETFKVNDKGLE